MTVPFYPDDPDGPETTQEAIEAFVESCRDLWHVAGVPVAEKAVDALQAGVETWRSWWKPMDLSGPWTAGWTPTPVLLAEIMKEIWEGVKEAFMGKGSGPELRGIQGARPHFVIRDEVAAFETNTIRMGVDLPPGMTLDEWIEVHRPPMAFIDPATFIDVESPRAFQDVTTGEWMVDDGEDAIDEEVQAMIRGNLRRGFAPGFWEGLSTPPEAFQDEEGDPCP